MAFAGEEDDYMSNDILNQCEDKRPGLMSKEAARRVKAERRHKELSMRNKVKPRMQLEKESREQALQTAIQPNNKGFAMLQKMGYKPGMSLGRTGQDGRKEPVPLELKFNRTGIGHDKEKQKKRVAAQQAAVVTLQKRQKVEQVNITDYRSRKRNDFTEKLAEKDLYDSQKVCYQLDQQTEVAEPLQAYFWPAAATAASASEDEEDDEEEQKEEVTGDEVPAAEKLETLTAYLRETHLYCVWCGTKYDDKEDIKRNCPGNTRQDHDD